jgi:Coenzyme PQQ synthesis protein D (PqqD)
MLTLNSIIQRDPEVIAAEADQDLVMVSIPTGYYYGVSDVARAIWDAIERPQKISDLIENLMASYHVDLATCRDQTLAFLETLCEERLLQVNDDPPS